VESSDEMGMMTQLSIYCSRCRILRCACKRGERARRASIRRQWRCQFGVPNPVPAVAEERIRTLDLLRLGFWHFCFLEGGLGSLGQSFPLLKLHFGSSIFQT
jgi:hypothetical protein